MKILSSVMLAMLIAVAHTTAAGSWRDGGRGRMYDVQAQRQPPGGMQRQPPRDSRPAERPPERGRHDGRMTDDERRDLRRDIDRANREIYKGR